MPSDERRPRSSAPREGRSARPTSSRPSSGARSNSRRPSGDTRRTPRGERSEERPSRSRDSRGPRERTSDDRQRPWRRDDEWERDDRPNGQQRENSRSGPRRTSGGPGRRNDGDRRPASRDGRGGSGDGRSGTRGFRGDSRPGARSDDRRPSREFRSEGGERRGSRDVSRRDPRSGGRDVSRSGPRGGRSGERSYRERDDRGPGRGSRGGPAGARRDGVRGDGYRGRDQRDVGRSVRPGERRTSARIASTGVSSSGKAKESTQGRLSATWVRDDAPVKPTSTSTATPKKVYVLPADIAAEIRRSFTGSAYQRERLVSFMTDAAQAYDRHRYEEALRLAKNVALSVPTVAAAQELAGLAAYRAERFAMARKFLRAAFDITGDGQHLPLVMDCERAARRYSLVRRSFEQLMESEPTPDVAAEGRIVLASTLADQSQFSAAIEVLTAGGALKVLRNPSGRHLRLWYALGDVYDKAGDAAMARELFARVVGVDPEAYDAYQRLEELGGTTVRKNRKKKTAPVSKKKNVR